MNELIIDCPICNKKVPWSNESKFRPFCSERCKILDLGAWADGNRTIPSDAENDDVTSSDLGKYD